MSLFSHDMIVHVENLKELTKKTIIISDYSMVAGYKVNMLTSAALPDTSIEQAEFEIKNTIK